MKIIRNNIIPFKGFKAINLFGILFVRGNAELSDEVINHESIHTAQMKEMLYIPFYIWYGIEYLCKRWNYTAKEARDMFKSRRSYTKWFNTVPLLGVGALGVNKYFVNNEGENYDFRQER